MPVGVQRDENSDPNSAVSCSCSFFSLKSVPPASTQCHWLWSVLCPFSPLHRNRVGISMGIFPPCPYVQGCCPLNPTHFSLISFPPHLALPELLWAWWRGPGRLQGELGSVKPLGRVPGGLRSWARRRNFLTKQMNCRLVHCSSQKCWVVFPAAFK